MMLPILLTALLAQGQLSEPAARPLVIHGATVLPMETDGALVGQTIVIEGDLIRSLGKDGEVTHPVNAHVIDGTGWIVMPGLIDSHVHLFDQDDATLMLAHGVTGMFNLSGSRMHLKLRDSIERGETLAPRLVTTGPMLKIDAAPLLEFEENILTPGDARAAVQAHAAAGYDFIKIWGAISSETYAAVVEEAERLKIRVTGHIPHSVGLEGILKGKQSSIAHVEEFTNKHFEAQATAAELRVSAEHVAASGTVVITTLITYEAIAGSVATDMAKLLARPGRQLLDPVRQMMWTPGANRFRSEGAIGRDVYFLERLAFKQRVALALHRAGVPLLAGTDSGELPGLVPGLDMHRELELLVQAGLSPQAALQAATLHPGLFLFPGSAPVGVIRPGARADLLLLAANPLEDISATRRVLGVVTRGRILDRTALDSMLERLRQRNEQTSAFVSAFIEGGVDAAEACVEELQSTNIAEPAFALTPSLFLALSFAQRGAVDQAMDLLFLISSVHQDAPEPLYILAGMAIAGGDVDAAKALFEEVLALAPDHERAKRELARLGM